MLTHLQQLQKDYIIAIQMSLKEASDVLLVLLAEFSPPIYIHAFLLYAKCVPYLSCKYAIAYSIIYDSVFTR